MALLLSIVAKMLFLTRVLLKRSELVRQWSGVLTKFFVCNFLCFIKEAVLPFRTFEVLVVTSFVRMISRQYTPNIACLSSR